MKRNPEYRGSGVEWIGKIPTHWKTVPFMHCLKKVHTKKKTSIQKMDYQVSGEFPVIDQGASFIAGRTDLTDCVISDNLPVVIFGDHTRIFKYVDFPFALGADGTQLLYPNDEFLNPRFFYYALLNLKIPNKGYNRHFRYLREFSVACPALCTQTHIAAFLDRKTGQIDELVLVKERKIKLLQEQRTALINQAVTKGLDPNAALKPSGVEWIGEIPAHWKIINTKYLFRLVAEQAPPNHDYELLSIYTDIGVKPRKELEEKGNRATTTDGYWIVRKGDFIVNKLLAWMGAIGLSNYEGVTSPAYDILRKIRPLNERFYEYLFRCGLYFTEFKKRSKGIMEVRLRLYFDRFGQIPLVFPPVDDQDKIVNFLDHKAAQIDELISEELRSMELLKEYRQSLISDAVTGKIDVQNEV